MGKEYRIIGFSKGENFEYVKTYLRSLDMNFVTVGWYHVLGVNEGTVKTLREEGFAFNVLDE